MDGMKEGPGEANVFKIKKGGPSETIEGGDRISCPSKDRIEEGPRGGKPDVKGPL